MMINVDDLDDAIIAYLAHLKKADGDDFKQLLEVQIKKYLG